MNHSINFCPKSEALLPEYGRSAFVRAAVIAYAAMRNGALTPTPPPIEENAEPVAWVRTWHRPGRDFPDGFDMTTLIWDKARKVFLNTPPWPTFPSLDMEQARSWSLYVDKWHFPDPFPGPLEWHSMGEPSEPLPEHQVTTEPVEPLPVVVPAPSQEPPPAAASLPVVVPAPSQESPLPAAVPPVEPLPVVGVSSSNILEEV